MADSATDRATLLIAAPSATVAFALAFNLGAFDVVFFDSIFTVWVLATLVLVGSLISRNLPPRHWAGRIVLLLPTGWLVVAILDDPGVEETAEKFLLAASLVITLVVFPLVAWMLISAINPEFVALPAINKGIIVGAVVLFAFIGYFVGARNDLFLSCEDFRISGNDLPANCAEEPSDQSGELHLRIPL